MMTRLIVNLSQVYIPLFVTDSLFLPKVSSLSTKVICSIRHEAPIALLFTAPTKSVRRCIDHFS